MEKNKLELRTLPMTEIRIHQADGGGAVIEGHAAVFDSWSETLGGIFPFKEKVSSGAFQRSIKTDDIRALWNHDPNYVLGRNLSGTLELAEDEKGLKVRIIPPDTQWARDLEVSIERGDVNQMSFGFIVQDDDWKSENGVDVRELKKVKLFDVSPVTFPAYTATDVGLRGLESYNEYRTKIDNSNKETQNAREQQRLKNLKTKFKIM